MDSQYFGTARNHPRYIYSDQCSIDQKFKSWIWQGAEVRELLEIPGHQKNVESRDAIVFSCFQGITLFITVKLSLQGRSLASLSSIPDSVLFVDQIDGFI
jgi:hypothetical protein